MNKINTPEFIPDRQQDKNENENSDQVMTEANSMFKTSYSFIVSS